MAIAFITGSGKRLGKALAIKYAEKGWDIALHYNHSEEGVKETQSIIKKLSVKSEVFQCDLLNVDQIKSVFMSCTDKLGIPQVLVNNAGVFQDKKSLNEISEDDWDNVMDLNLKSILFASKEFSKIAQKNSRIINIASLGAVEIWNQRIPYNISKSALLTLTKVLARDLAPDISVNSVSPGAIYLSEEDKIKFVDKNKIPFQRFGNSDDVFDAVNFFSTCSNYITGQNLIVDGGLNLI